MAIPDWAGEGDLFHEGFAYLKVFFQREGAAHALWAWAASGNIPPAIRRFPTPEYALVAADSVLDPKALARMLAIVPVKLNYFVVGNISIRDLEGLVSREDRIQGWLAGSNTPAQVATLTGLLGPGVKRPRVLKAPVWLSPSVSRAPAPSAPSISSHPDSGFIWKVDGAPFFMRGVAYNPSHDWQDGSSPLVQTVLVRDMADIKAMGANTIRRYAPGIYDYNILREAHKQDLKVIFGFWFDPETDFYADSSAVKTYVRETMAKVRKYKDSPAVLAWSVGNETWGILKHYHRPAYLVRVRKAYLQMIETLAREIKAIDPDRPVFTVMEHSPDLASELLAVRSAAPSLDFFGVNSYYEAQISQLDSLCKRFFPEKPYLVSEFGPEGYWDTQLTELDEFGHPKEPGDFAKAYNYTQHWSHYVQGKQGANLGGVAFCWKDRMEETITWFGLTDSKYRKKPAYFALQSLWTEKPFEFPLEEIHISHPWQVEDIVTLHLITAMEDTIPRNLRYEWSVREDNYLRPMKNFEVHGEGRRFGLDLSQLREGRKYRAFLHMAHPDGKVVTASVPLVVNPYPYRQ